MAEVSAALGVSTHCLYSWLKEFKKPVEVSAAEEEVKRLQAELRKVTEERDILKEAAAYFASQSRRGRHSLPGKNPITLLEPCAR